MALASIAVSPLVAHPLSARGDGVESSTDETSSVDIQRTHQILAGIAENIGRHSDRLYLWNLSESLGGGRASTTSLDLSIESGAANAVTVRPGASVHYQIVGILSDDANQGLALVGFDLVFDGGDLAQADEPDGEPTPGCDNPMVNFALPWGLSNPAGFGGTVLDGDLIQVGGGQNTIMNGQV
ncbi:MAG: hypothetical protein IH987_10760, partial [Planctomycetes bacterium]|nr:hypothetical protein [Planctomycetota bacterium]